jgi:hypothetical protein
MGRNTVHMRGGRRAQSYSHWKTGDVSAVPVRYAYALSAHRGTAKVKRMDTLSLVTPRYYALHGLQPAVQRTRIQLLRGNVTTRIKNGQSVKGVPTTGA